MKIAIPNQGKLVNQHFGKSTSFIIADIEEGKVQGTKEISTADLLHQHEGLVDLLLKNGATLVITGGIGQGAFSALEDSGLKVIRGASGEYLEVISQYLMGNLETKGGICDHHEEQGSDHECNH